MNTSANQQALVICEEAENYEQIRTVAAKAGVKSIYCRKIDEARNFLAKHDINVVFCQDTLPDGDFRAVIAEADGVPVIVLSRFAEWDHYLAALREGAFDYIACPPMRMKPSAFCSRQSARAGNCNAKRISSLNRQWP